MVASFFNSYSLFQIDMGFLVLFHTFQAQLALRQMQKEADGEYEDPDRQYLEDDEEPRKKEREGGGEEVEKAVDEVVVNPNQHLMGQLKLILPQVPLLTLLERLNQLLRLKMLTITQETRLRLSLRTPPKEQRQNQRQKKEEGNASKKRARTKSPSAKEAETTKKLAMESKEIQETKNVEDCIEAVVNPI